MQYMEAPEVKEIAQDIIANLPLDSRVPEAKVVYLFSLAEKSDYAGKIERPSGTWRYLSNYDFVILIHQNSWKDLDEDQRKALIYHELLHITHRVSEDGNITWKIRKHDFEDFTLVVEKFGYWSPELKELKEAGELSEVDEEK